MSCCQEKACRKQTAPHETFTELPVKLLMQLLELSNSGGASWSIVKYLNIKNPEVRQLALQIARLATENNLLNKLLRRSPPPSTPCDYETVALNFGPNASYTLTIPVLTAQERQTMMQQFSAGLAALQTAPGPDRQKQLCFLEDSQ